jgi:hypothetical protein
MQRTPLRPPNHVTADVGETAAALVLKKWGWTADTVISDYGEDLDCFIFVDSLRTSLHFRCQVKSTADTEDHVRRLKSGDFGVSISTSTCKVWLLNFFPVLLVVYDNATGRIWWGDASEQVRKRMSKLSQKTITLYVSRTNSLASSRSKITDTVQQFYSQLMRLSTRALTCQVYPVIMPGYRAIPMDQIIHAKSSRKLPKHAHIEFTTGSKNWLPAWTTSIKTLEQYFVTGLAVTTTGRDIHDFSRLLRNALLNLPLSIAKSEWVSYVCSPVQFKANDEVNTENSIWNKELTPWRNYTRFGSVLVSDDDYAFATPAGFLRQVARRATSWEKFHHVDPLRDVSIQLFALVAATPGERWDIQAMRQHIEGQFIPWICDSTKVDQLNKLLLPLELAFRKVPDIPSPRGQETGIICTFFFEPGVGLFTPAHAWSEFTDGTVKSKLEATRLVTKLPGERGPAEVSELILGMFGNLRDDPPASFITTEMENNSGLPLDHRERRVQVQRFREVTALNRDLVNKILEQCKKEIVRQLGKSHWAECSFDLFEAWPYKQVAELSVVWQPPFDESSAQSFERFEPTVLRAFDKILPRRFRAKKKPAMTHEVLRFAGSLYFEDGY